MKKRQSKETLRQFMHAIDKLHEENTVNYILPILLLIKLSLTSFTPILTAS